MFSLIEKLTKNGMCGRLASTASMPANRTCREKCINTLSGLKEVGRLLNWSLLREMTIDITICSPLVNIPVTSTLTHFKFVETRQPIKDPLVIMQEKVLRPSLHNIKYIG